jgi:prepilin-type N-terminal cleavage/methylation domain-containing protein
MSAMRTSLPIAVRGFSLIEVVIAMLVFAVGLAGFATLQTALTRSSMDARLRTVSASIGEETFELQRRFTRLSSDPAGTEFAYEDIVDGSRSVSRGGFSFTIDQVVTDYYWDRSSSQFSTSSSASEVHSDFKRVDLLVAWDDPVPFNQPGAADASSLLGSGNISLSSIIPSSVTSTRRLALIDDLNGENFELPVTIIPPIIGILPLP